MKREQHQHAFKPRENGRSLFSRSLICQVCSCGKARWFVGGRWTYMLAPEEGRPRDARA